jgi:uncharacterized protein YceH (UPF0502 family)
MTELLLRGAQTVGELRGRAARMEPIADLAALQPVLDGLIRKGLVISLTPPGRGQIVTHSLYLPDELEKVRSQARTRDIGESPPEAGQPIRGIDTTVTRSAATDTSLDELRADVEELRAEVDRLKREVQDLWSNVR